MFLSTAESIVEMNLYWLLTVRFRLVQRIRQGSNRPSRVDTPVRIPGRSFKIQKPAFQANNGPFLRCPLPSPLKVRCRIDSSPASWQAPYELSPIPLRPKNRLLASNFLPCRPFEKTFSGFSPNTSETLLICEDIIRVLPFPFPFPHQSTVTIGN